MDQSLSDHIKQLNTQQYKNQCRYIAKKLISMEPNDIKYLTFLRKLQIIFTGLPYIAFASMKDLEIESEKSCNHCFNSDVFDEYFCHKIEAHITIFCKRTSRDEYLLTIPLKNNLEDITSTINIKDKDLQHYLS